MFHNVKKADIAIKALQHALTDLEKIEADNLNTSEYWEEQAKKAEKMKDDCVAEAARCSRIRKRLGDLLE